MTRWFGRALGVIAGIAIVINVDGSIFDAPTWLQRDGEANIAQAGAAPARQRAQPAAEAATKIRVTGIVDGDTLTVADGRQVRLAQVDAAERGRCYSREATDALRRMTEGETVELRRRPTGPARDRYGRALADVVVGGESVNETLVREGYAGWYESFAHEDLDLARRLEAAEREAQAGRRGQWSACKAS